MFTKHQESHTFHEFQLVSGNSYILAPAVKGVVINGHLFVAPGIGKYIYCTKLARAS